LAADVAAGSIKYSPKTTNQSAFPEQPRAEWGGRCHAAIQDITLTGGETGFVRGEPHREAGDVLWFSETTGRMAGEGIAFGG